MINNQNIGVISAELDHSVTNICTSIFLSEGGNSSKKPIGFFTLGDKDKGITTSGSSDLHDLIATENLKSDQERVVREPRSCWKATVRLDGHWAT